MEAQNWGVKKGSIIGIFQGYLWCIIFLTFALAFWYGSQLVIDTKELSPGTLIQVRERNFAFHFLVIVRL